MVGIFKRFAKIGGGVGAGDHETLSDLAKAYTALVAATDFLEVCIRVALPVCRLLTFRFAQFEDGEASQISRPRLFT